MSLEILALSAADLRQAAPIGDLIDWMRDAMRITSDRAVSLPLRREFELPDDLGKIGMMPGFVADEINMAGVKLVSLVPPHRRKGSSHLGMMILYDADGLQPKSIMCGSTITAIRTSAVSAVATDVLARKEAKVLTILGTGEQARAHARAMCQVRQFSDLRVWGRNPAAIAEFVRDVFDSDGLRFRAMESLQPAVEGADVICTVTAGQDPVSDGLND